MVGSAASVAVVVVASFAGGSAPVGYGFGIIVRHPVLFVEPFCVAVVLEVAFDGWVSVAVEELNQIPLIFFYRFLSHSPKLKCSLESIERFVGPSK